ncbi:GTPase-activating protein and VPS9 domain-containing protein [Schistosoma japonicum]|uniref:GTPase-activating protein and VPS9 domain-containing protein n=1 Tax=Schistosoma japonicum TaxID=6182 RepID=A0A4Z2CX84_SCHJA|nr:GTPase-activating protein and VPS9 domain-containing protein [Schistosoma japonicum]
MIVSMFESLCNDLISIILEIYEDNNFYDHHIRTIKVIELEINGLHDSLRKLSWFYHHLRARNVLRALKLSDFVDVLGFPYCSFSTFKYELPASSIRSSFIEFFRLFRKNPLFIAELLHYYRFSVHVAESLFRSVCSAMCTDPMNPPSNSVQLVIAHYLQKCLNIMKCAIHTKSDLIVLVHLLVFCTPDIRLFLNSIFQNIFYRLTNNCSTLPFNIPESDEDPTKSDSGTSNSGVSMVLLVNIIINSLSDNILLFPHSLLVLLGNMRHIWSTAGLSQEDILRACMDFVFKDLIASAVEKPELYNINLNFVLFPKLLQILKKAIEILPSVVIEGETCQITASVINQNDLKIVDNECTKIKYEQLRTFTQFIVGASDSMAFPHSLFEVHPKDLLTEDRELQPTEPDDYIQKDSCKCDVISITSNDLNILVGCIRLFLQSTSSRYPFFKMISHLPHYVPGATVEVKRALDNSPSGDSSCSDANVISAVLVNVSENIAAKTSTHEIKWSNNSTPSPQRRRSRSLNRLFNAKHNFSSNFKGTQINSVDGVKNSSLPRKNVISNNENSEVVYLFDLNSCNHSYHHNIHFENQVSRSWRVRRGKNKTDHPVVKSTNSHGDDGDVTMNHAYLNVIRKINLNDNNHSVCDVVASSVSSGSNRSNHPHFEQYRPNNEVHSIENINTGDGNYNVCEPQCSPLESATSSFNIRKQSSITFSKNHFLTGQRSSDESTSQNSDPSGCTSLASSACALGRRIQTVVSGNESLQNKNVNNMQSSRGISHPTSVSGPSINSSSHISSFSPSASPNHSFNNSLNGDINNRTTQYVACSSLSHGIEKRTRFSISVLPSSSSSVRGFGNSPYISNRTFLVQSKVSETRCANGRSSIHPSVVRCSSIDLSKSGLVNHSNPSTEGENKINNHKSQIDFVSSLPTSNKLLHNDNRSTIQPRCSSLTSLCMSTGISSLSAHRHSEKLSSNSNQDIECQGTSSFSVDSTSSDSDSDNSLIGAAVSQHSTASSSCHLNSSFLQSYQNSHDQTDIREVDEQSSLLTCSSCGVRLGEDVNPDPIPENVESEDADISSGQIGTQVDEQSSYPRDEEDALSDLPLSSANISGRVTPLSLTSTTSRGVPLTQSSIHCAESNCRVAGMFPQSGLILPTGTMLPSNAAHLGLTRCGPPEFPTIMFQRQCTSDVTEKFNKFDLPPSRMTENETRSTVSETWSTDVLPSDTEYADLGQEFSNSQSSLNPEVAGRRLSSHSIARVSHRHGHRHHHRRTPASESLINESSENNFRSLNAASESESREIQLRVQPDSSLNGVENAGQNGTDLISLNDHVHPRVASPPSISQYQDNLDEPQPINSSHSNHHCSVSMVSTLGATCHTASISTKLNATINITGDEKFGGGLKSSDERRNLNTNRLHGSAYALKESFSRLMERLDLIARRPRISSNPCINKRQITSTSQYNESQSNLYPILPDLIESTSTEPAAYSHDNQQFLNPLPSTSFLPWDYNTMSSSNQLTQLPVKSLNSNQQTDGCVEKEETVDEMMERYRRQTRVISPKNSVSNHISNWHHSHDKKRASTSDSIKKDNNNSNRNFSSITPPQSSSSSTSSSPSSSPVYLHPRKSIPQLFNLALHGLQEVFSNSTLNIIALNTVQKLKSTWEMTHNNQLLSEQMNNDNNNVTSVFNENQIFFLLLNSMLSGLLYDAQRNSTIINILIETRNILLELSNLLENHTMNSGYLTMNANDKIDTITTEEDNLHQHCWQFNSNNEVSSCSLTKCLISSLRQYLKQYRDYRIQLIKNREQLNQLKSNLELSVSWLQQSIHLQQEYITNRNLSELINQHKQLFREFHQNFTSEEFNCNSKLRIKMVQKLVTQLIDKMKMKWRESYFFDDCFTSSSISSLLVNRSDVTQLPMNNSMKSNNDVESIFIQLERLVMNEIYPYVIWINNPSIEKERDELFHRELTFLQDTITPTELRISEAYHIVLPLKSVQNELLLLDCYHTSSDKLHCLKRVINHILAALQLANPTSIPCADDLLPVLIYLVIQANPPRLLSNIEFVNNFGGDTLDGELQYIWCQFCSAVAEIRHLMSIRPMNDNTNHSTNNNSNC